MTYDIVLSIPADSASRRVAAIIRSMNKSIAQLIGESQFSKTIDITQFQEVSPIRVKTTTYWNDVVDAFDEDQRHEDEQDMAEDMQEYEDMIEEIEL